MIPRSLLFVPGDDVAKFDKAAKSNADALILDLEDSVDLSRKPDARKAVAAYLQGSAKPRRPLLYVRINPLTSDHALADLAAITPGAPDGIVLPKAEGRDDIVKLDHFLSAFEAASGLAPGSTAVLPIATETPTALFKLESYAGVSHRLIGLTWGQEDLPVAIGAETNKDLDGKPTDLCRLARSLCLLGAAAAELPAFETVFIAYRDPDALRLYAEAGRREGFVGMMAIHPAQVSVINEVFTPQEAELTRAQEIVRLFEEHPGRGVTSLNGEMLDLPHLKRARALLARSRG